MRIMHPPPPPPQGGFYSETWPCQGIFSHKGKKREARKSLSLCHLGNSLTPDARSGDRQHLIPLRSLLLQDARIQALVKA